MILSGFFMTVIPLMGAPVPGQWKITPDRLVSGENTIIDISYIHTGEALPAGTCYMLRLDNVSVKSLFHCRMSDAMEVLPYKGDLPHIELKPQRQSGIGIQDVIFEFPDGLKSGDSFSPFKGVNEPMNLTGGMRSKGALSVSEVFALGYKFALNGDADSHTGLLGRRVVGDIEKMHAFPMPETKCILVWAQKLSADNRLTVSFRNGYDYPVKGEIKVYGAVVKGIEQNYALDRKLVNIQDSGVYSFRIESCGAMHKMNGFGMLLEVVSKDARIECTFGDKVEIINLLESSRPGVPADELSIDLVTD